jgi:hypothetical protein
VLLTLNKHDFHKLYKRARQGDEAAFAELDSLWNPYRDQSLPCFLCDSEVTFPVATIMLPEHKQSQTHHRRTAVPAVCGPAAWDQMEPRDQNAQANVQAQRWKTGAFHFRPACTGTESVTFSVTFK